MPPLPPYLRPYIDAARDHGGSFNSLLWASRDSQLNRFTALTNLLDFTGLSVLDVGCGRADFNDHLDRIGQVPAEYLGIEAVPALASAAQAAGVEIIQQDFVAEPRCLFTGSDVVLFCGSLNTFPDDIFFSTLKRAFDAAARHLLFNFLSSPLLAGASHLYWRRPDEVDRFCRNLLSLAPTRSETYMEGDATFLLSKPAE